MDRYIGLDAHASSCTVATVGPSGRRLHSQVVETNAGALIRVLRGIAGILHLCLEEGTHASWLYEVLSPHVEEIVVAGVGKSRARFPRGLWGTLSSGALLIPDGVHPVLVVGIDHPGQIVLDHGIVLASKGQQHIPPHAVLGGLISLLDPLQDRCGLFLRLPQVREMAGDVFPVLPHDLHVVGFVEVRDEIGESRGEFQIGMVV